MGNFSVGLFRERLISPAPQLEKMIICLFPTTQCILEGLVRVHLYATCVVLLYLGGQQWFSLLNLYRAVNASCTV